MERIFRVTVERCIACGKCELACAFTHGDAGMPGLSRIRVLRHGSERGVPITCFQCDDAACVAICPVSALVYDSDTGAVVHSSARCVGCGMCVAGCPFGNIVWDEPARRVAKCDICRGAPRCVPFCPTGALEYPAVESNRLGPQEVQPAGSTQAAR